MKKIFASLIILTIFVLAIGCQQPAAKPSAPAKTTTPTATAPSSDTSTSGATETVTAGTETTTEAVSELDSDLKDIENLDDDFLDSELEDLDTELDFEI